MNEKLKELESVIMFYNTSDDIYADGNSLRKGYRLKEDYLKICIEISFLNNKVEMRAYDALNNETYEFFVFDDEQKVEELISVISDSIYGGLSLFELREILSEKFAPVCNLLNVTNTIMHNLNNDPIFQADVEKVRKSFREYIEECLIQKIIEGDDE